MSRPTRACGLKHSYSNEFLLNILVTPHTGVWIETSVCNENLNTTKSHAPHGRVD